MQTTMKMVYWKSETYWVGKLLEHPEIMTQGETLEELEENMRDAYLLMTMDDVPENVFSCPDGRDGAGFSFAFGKSGIFFLQSGEKTRRIDPM